jgi:hypothetical protein
MTSRRLTYRHDRKRSRFDRSGSSAPHGPGSRSRCPSRSRDWFSATLPPPSGPGWNPPSPARWPLPPAPCSPGGGGGSVLPAPSPRCPLPGRDRGSAKSPGAVGRVPDTISPTAPVVSRRSRSGRSRSRSCRPRTTSAVGSRCRRRGSSRWSPEGSSGRCSSGPPRSRNAPRTWCSGARGTPCSPRQRPHRPGPWARSSSRPRWPC